MAIESVSEKNFGEILRQNKIVVLEAYATWCGYCKMFAPTLEKIAEEAGSRAKFCKIDADQNQDFIESLGVDLYPTLLYFKDGGLALRAPNVSTKDAILSALKSLGA